MIIEALPDDEEEKSKSSRPRKIVRPQSSFDDFILGAGAPGGAEGDREKSPEPEDLRASAPTPLSSSGSRTWESAGPLPAFSSASFSSLGPEPTTFPDSQHASASVPQPLNTPAPQNFYSPAFPQPSQQPLHAPTFLGQPFEAGHQVLDFQQPGPVHLSAPQHPAATQNPSADQFQGSSWPSNSQSEALEASVPPNPITSLAARPAAPPPSFVFNPLEFQRDRSPSVGRSGSGTDKKKLGKLKACARCRSLKLKCDEGRPCKQCLRYSCGENCRPEGELQLEVTRVPVGFTGRQITLEFNEDYSFNHMLDKRKILANFFGAGAGFKHDAVYRMLDGFTDDLYSTIIDGMSALQLVQTGRTDARVLDNVSSLGTPQCTVGLTPDEFSDLPYMCEIYDFKKMASTGFTFNRRMSEFIGMSSEEMFNRIANSEFDVLDLGPEMEVVSFFLDDFTSILDREMVSYGIVPKNGMKGRMLGQGQLVKTYRRRDIDAETHVMTNHMWMMPIEPGEFDYVKQQNPKNFRSVFRALGDDRSGKQLLADYAQDAARGLKKMLLSAKGREKIQRLSEECKRRFRPLTEQAKRLLHTSSEASVASSTPGTPLSNWSPEPVAHIRGTSSTSSDSPHSDSPHGESPSPYPDFMVASQHHDPGYEVPTHTSGGQHLQGVRNMDFYEASTRSNGRLDHSAAGHAQDLLSSKDTMAVEADADRTDQISTDTTSLSPEEITGLSGDIDQGRFEGDGCGRGSQGAYNLAMLATSETINEADGNWMEDFTFLEREQSNGFGSMDGSSRNLTGMEFRDDFPAQLGERQLSLNQWGTLAIESTPLD